MSKPPSKIISTCLLVGISPIVLANMNTTGFQLSGYGGVANTSLDTGNYMLAGEQLEVLSSKNNSSLNFAWGLGGAYRILFNRNLLHDLSFGLDLLQFTNTQTGDLLDYGSLNNSTYQLTFNSTRLMADSEWTFQPIHTRLYPFFEAGLGFSANRADYDTTPNPDAFWQVGQKMSSNTAISLAYQVGAGVKIPLSNAWVVSLRYLYAGLGQVKTNTKTSNLLATTGINSSAHTQNWLAGLSYLL